MPPYPTKLPLEVAVFSGASAIQAQHGGAHRVELNAPGSYPYGGLTPPTQELTSAAKWLQIPVRVMIRPVGASLEFPPGRDFMYTADQFETMKSSIADFKALGVMNPCRGDGFVFGILAHAPRDHIEQDDRARIAVDIPRCTELVRLALPFPCIFHRAFDPICDTNLLNQGLRDLATCGFEGVLTSGGAGSHENHLERLDAMMCHMKLRDNLHLMQLVVGGGVRSYNADKAVAKLGTHVDGAVWMHSACLTNHPDHPGENIDDIELRDLISRLELARPE